MTTFAELIERDDRCRFPLGDDRHLDDRWCGADTGGAGSWCAVHRARVFLTAEQFPRAGPLVRARTHAREAVLATWWDRESAE